MTDPRLDVTHDVEIGQVYLDSRTDEPRVLVYLDKQVYLLRDEDGNHVMGKRKDFESNVGAGRWEYAPDHDGFGNTGRLSRVLARAERYRDEGGRKPIHYADALEEAVSILTDDGAKDDRDPVPLEELDGIGETGAENLRQADYKTKGDFRHADDDDLLEISWVGEKGVTAIREYVEG